MCSNDKVTLKVIWNEEIIGAKIAFNTYITLAIQKKYTIDKLALLDLFFLPHFNKPVNFITLAGLEALKKAVNSLYSVLLLFLYQELLVDNKKRINVL
ncbi:MAG: hypothetical protein ACK5NF_00185 [Bacilli bacterium]